MSRRPFTRAVKIAARRTNRRTELRERGAGRFWKLTMAQKLRLCVVAVLAVALMSLSLAQVLAEEDLVDDILGDEMDVEDDLDLGIAGDEEEEEAEIEEKEAEPAAPVIPKVTYKAPEPMGQWSVEDMKDSKLPGDKGLVLKSRAKHHAISAQLLRPFIFDTKPLIDQFVDKTGYTIMFGPDKCGEDYKLHFIFRHKNLKTGEYEEKHAKKPDADLRTYYTDKKTHLYTLVLNPDNSFEVLVDQTVVNSGNLLTDMSPAVNPTAEIEDPDDHKPEDWDERPKIQDPDAVKPEDWDEDAPAQVLDDGAVKPDGWLDDEPEYISDPDSIKPEDWDEDMDGEWEAPQVPNPACESAPGCGAWQRPTMDNPNYKGKWKPAMIDNPNYQGVWKPRKIANPDFFEDLHPFRMTPFSAVGLELWSMSSDIFFDNFFITNERNTADRWATDGWGLKKAAEGAAEPGLATQMLTAAEERPWLWVVYVLTVALPLVLIIVFCCTGKKKTPDSEYKKTDEPQPDVKEAEEEEAVAANQEEQEGAAAADKASDAEDNPAEKGDEGEGEGEDDEEEEEDEMDGEEEERDDDDNDASTEKQQEDDILRRSPRNKKVRKD
ncbi:hypothetical protein CRUP_016025 [Coryphaenoides rupestris]|nr:hypothetical protein CRUP_016025 [Coryphaenoides rupestris]